MKRFYELALLYFPGVKRDSAVQMLSRWIKRCTHLQSDLRNSGYRSGQRYLSRIQIERIYYHLGRRERVRRALKDNKGIREIKGFKEIKDSAVETIYISSQVHD